MGNWKKELQTSQDIGRKIKELKRFHPDFFPRPVDLSANGSEKERRCNVWQSAWPAISLLYTGIDPCMIGAPERNRLGCGRGGELCERRGGDRVSSVKESEGGFHTF